ncbi:LAGLIDADG family homing endonuclease [Candidatus Woesearchaeota archaeon]|nr:LAGLIDADG family homing endonuclease [Candidatus Woesearchaeota archaeon]
MKELDNLSKKELLQLLSIIVLSDGTIAKKKQYLGPIKLETVYYNKCQHSMFKQICKKLFNKELHEYIYLCNNKKIISSRLYGKKYVKELLRLSPSYQTSPGPILSKKEFLDSAQPSIKHILENKNIKLKRLALRTYFDFDGSIVPSFYMKYKKDKKNGKIYSYYQIQFECPVYISETNPYLIKELVVLCKNLGLNAVIKKDKRNWSGIEGLRISELKSIKKFISWGGPISGVKISLKSHRFFGKTKKLICNRINYILNKGIPLSYYFKDEKGALEKKKELDKLLFLK